MGRLQCNYLLHSKPHAASQSASPQGTLLPITHILMLFQHLHAICLPQAAFNRVVIPALDAFQPQLLLVSSGFDASFMDNLAAMALSSEDYRYVAWPAFCLV